jgi:hypothetical protein
MRPSSLSLPAITALPFALMLALPAFAQDTRRPAPPPQVTQMIIERRTVIRISPHEERTRAPLNFRDWREVTTTKCFPVAMLAGIVISTPDSIDMVLRGGRLIRARLEKGCPSIDFYSGFYLKPTSDGLLCEDRDTIHSRAGGACEVDKFRILLPPRR